MWKLAVAKPWPILSLTVKANKGLFPVKRNEICYILRLLEQQEYSLNKDSSPAYLWRHEKLTNVSL